MVAAPLSLAFDAQFHQPLCGIDEAGRGPWAGPVVAAALIWPENQPVPAILNDSKKLSARKRETLYAWLCNHARYGIGIASVEEIDGTNILRATHLAMQRAFEALGAPPVPLALIDGNQPPTLPCQTRAVIKGDGCSPSIAGASILAKVTRDRLMSELAVHYPAYGFDRHAGYGTAQHQRALAEHGPCPAHRRSFAPIRALLEARAS